MFRHLNQVLSASSPTLPHSRSHTSRFQGISLPTLPFSQFRRAFRLNRIQHSFPSLLQGCDGFSLSGRDQISFRKTVYSSDRHYSYDVIRTLQNSTGLAMLQVRSDQHVLNFQVGNLLRGNQTDDHFQLL